MYSRFRLFFFFRDVNNCARDFLSSIDYTRIIRADTARSILKFGRSKDRKRSRVVMTRRLGVSFATEMEHRFLWSFVKVIPPSRGIRWPVSRVLLWEGLNVMIDCAGKKLNVALLLLFLACASTHRRFSPLYVSLPLRHPLLVASTGSDLILLLPPPWTRPPLYCFLPRRILITFAAAIVSISSNRPHPISQNVITSLTHELRPGVTLDAAWVFAVCLSLFFFLYFLS